MRTTRQGMALPVILIALFVFSIIMFAIAQQQQHETRYTAISLEQQRAFVLADAGLARAVGRCVARTYDTRWYGPAPNTKDDALPAIDHAGRFDEANQSLDETGAAGPPAADRKLEPNGTYSVLVEDRHVGEIGGDPPSENSRLAFTDVYSRGTIDGPHGEVSALLFARIAIAPEPRFFPPTPGVTPTVSNDESTPELVKRVIRYKVYFDAETAGHAYLQPNADSAALQVRVHNEVARFHQNFLKNRNTFKDLRDPSKVNATWQSGTATQAKWTKAQILGLFTGIAPAVDVPGGASAPTPGAPEPGAPPGTFANMWTDHMLRSYRVNDLKPANQGFKYVIGSHPGAQEDRVASNILHAFHPSIQFQNVRPEFRADATPGVTNGDQLLDLQGSQSQLNQPRETFNAEVSCFKREEASAIILEGHWKPHPWPPSPMPSPAPSPGPIAQEFADRDFKNAFLGTDLPVGTNIKQAMLAEIQRVNALGANPPLLESSYVASNPPGFEYYPLYLRYKEATDGPPPYTLPGAPPPAAGTPTQLSVPELVKFYSKYIESAALFSNGDPHQITPVPPVPTTPPSNRPPPSGNGGNGGGGNGTGGSRPGGYGISGRGSSM